MRILAIALAIFFALSCIISGINAKFDEIIIELARTGIVNAITVMINESIFESMNESGYGDIVSVMYDNEGRVRSMGVDSVKVNLLRADVSCRMAEKLSALKKFYVDVEISNVFDDALILNSCPLTFAVDVIPVGGVDTDVESELVSAGINQTNYRIKLSVYATITADVISAFTVDVSTSVNIVDMLIVGDVPNIMWGQ